MRDKLVLSLGDNLLGEIATCAGWIESFVSRAGLKTTTVPVFKFEKKRTGKPVRTPKGSVCKVRLGSVYRRL